MKAIIFGVTGQDGSYLSELLLDKGYEVVGCMRRSSTDTKLERLNNVLNHSSFSIEECDITDAYSVYDILDDADEVYNLAAQSHVHTSFKQPIHTLNVDAIGCLNILEGIRLRCPYARFVQASTSEMFGSNYTEINGVKYQNEQTAFSPNSPYAVAKLAAHHLVSVYRRSYNMHASAAIMFNHESPRRGPQFVTRKITRYIASLIHGYQINLSEVVPTPPAIDTFQVGSKSYPKLRLGNLKASRDWGHAEDYMRALYLMLQQDTPDDYVIATGNTYSVEDFLSKSFEQVDLDWKNFVYIDEKFYRPCEVEYLRGDASKAHKQLAWQPTIDIDDLVKDMVSNDLQNYS